VVEPAEHRASDHRPGLGTWAAGGAQRRRQGQAAVGPLRVVVGDVLPEGRLEVPLVEHQHVIQAFLAHGVWLTHIGTPR
jgi:hypothetical protein